MTPSLHTQKISAILLACVLFGTATFAQVAPGVGSLQDAVIARVNGKPLLLSQLKQMAMDLNLPVRSLTSEGLKGDGFRKAITLLIDEELLVQQARKLEMQLDDVEISRRVDQMIAGLIEGAGGREALNNQLRRSNLDLEGLRRTLIERETRSALSGAIIADRVSLSTRDVEKFIAERKNAGKGAREIMLAQILINCPKTEQDSPLGEQKRTRAFEIAKSASANTDRFSELAARTSEDKITAAQGGAIGWVDPDSLAKPLKDKVIQMRVGQVSSPVASETGFHILYVVAERTARDLLEARRYREERTELVKRLREQASLEVYPPDGGANSQ